MILTPPQKNIFKRDSIEDIIHEGALKSEIKLTCKDDRINLRRIKRPPKDKFQLFQSDNPTLIRNNTSFENTNCHVSPPIGRSKYQFLIFRTDVASFNQESLMLIPSSILLWKLNFKSRHYLKINKNNVHSLTLDQLLTPKSNASSTNWRREIIVGGCIPTRYPVKILDSTMVVIITCKPSAANKKRKGERWSSCLSPLSNGNSSIELPLTKIEVVVVPIHSSIHFLHNVGKDIYLLSHKYMSQVQFSSS